MSLINNNASTSVSPDLDWSQLRETVRLLSLSVAQIEMVMNDGDESVAALSNSFTGMAGEVKILKNILQTITEKNFVITVEQALERCASIERKMSDVIVAFQFYDRLSQRLSHIENSLENLTELVSDNNRLYKPSEWQQLQTNIRGRYTIERDKAMFDALMRGNTVEQSLDVWRNYTDNGKESEDIELF